MKSIMQFLVNRMNVSEIIIHP